MRENLDSGLSSDRLKLLPSVICKDVEAGLYDGGVILVARHGVIGLQEAIGFADKEKNRACRLDDVFWLMSVTKVFTSTVLLSQIEQGKLALTTRVNEIIPEFQGTYKDQVTVFQLLTHTAGSPLDAMPPGLLGDLKSAVDTACKMSLSSAPGIRVDYSPAWAHALLSEIIRRVDGEDRDLADVYEDNLFGPLKMKDTALGRRKDLVSRLVPIVMCGNQDDPKRGAMADMSPKIDRDTEPPRCCASTIHDLFRFGEMLRRGGELDGVRILSPTTIELATTNHTANIPNTGSIISSMFAGYGWPPFPLNMGLDFAVRGEGSSFPCPMGTLTSPRTYGRFGMGSTGFWVDPDRDVTFIFLSAGWLPEYANTFRFQRFSDMTMAAVK